MNKKVKLYEVFLEYIEGVDKRPKNILASTHIDKEYEKYNMYEKPLII